MCRKEDIKETEWIIHTKPIECFSVMDVISQIYQIGFRWNETVYHPSLEVFMREMEYRIAELVFLKEGNQVMDSMIYCQDLGDGLKGVSPSFVDECARFYWDVWDRFHQWREYHRYSVTITEADGLIYAPMPLDDPLDMYPYIKPDDEVETAAAAAAAAGIPGWLESWILNNVRGMVHVQIRKNFAPMAYGLLVRPGEYRRYLDASKKSIPKSYDIIKKFRSPEYSDYMDSEDFGKNDPHIFWDGCIKQWLEGGNDPIKDLGLMFMWDQFCCNADFNVRLPFAKECLFLDMGGENRFRIMASRDPLIVRCFNRFDVYYKGNIFHCQSASRAIVVWVEMVKALDWKWKTFHLQELATAIGMFSS